MMEPGDKHWARKYLLDPLTAPEPSQEAPADSSYYQQLRASTNYSNPPNRSHPSATSPDRLSARLHQLSLSESQKAQQSRSPRKPHHQTPDSLSLENTSSSGITTPPSSGSPTRTEFHPTNPYSKHQHTPQSSSASQNLSPPASPPRDYSDVRQHQHNLHHRSVSSQSAFNRPPGPIPQINIHRSVSSASRNPRPQRPPHIRQRSLGERFPGDMSHRPLDVLRREARVANRATGTNPSGSRHRRNISETDQIDALDTIGGAYHHGGPYDAAMTSRNLDSKYSPLAAVRDSNEEAIRATPREYVQDSLTKHMPLQGTSIIPPGAADTSGNVMNYSEGTDLMRENYSDGGPYGRYIGFDYHPDDLKGKGEPSFTIERDLKERKRLLRAGNPATDEYEMQSGVNGKPRMSLRRRSYNNATDSDVAKASGSSASHSNNNANADDLRRSHSTGGKKLSDGLKRRFGSIRRKNRLSQDVS